MTAFFMAWQMFLWIPCPKAVWDESKKSQMLLYMPAIGMIAGALWYLLFLTINTFAKNIGPVFSALLAVFPWLVTGFMHLDGYMDCADAALYFGNKEKKLAILKDSHVGSFAVISMTLLAVLQFSAVSQIAGIGLSNRQAAVLIFIPALTRSVSVSEVFAFEPLPSSSYVGLKDGPGFAKNAILHTVLMTAALLLAAFFLCGWRLCAAAVIGLAVQKLVMLYLRKNLGGISGDISGSGITVGELASLIAIAFI